MVGFDNSVKIFWFVFQDWRRARGLFAGRTKNGTSAIWGWPLSLSRS